MSVALFLKYGTPGREERLVPIATQQLFDKYWLPVSEEIGLQWIPIFRSGLPLNMEDIPFVTDELVRLREYMLQVATIPLEVREHAKERIDRLADELQTAQKDTDVHLYIG